MIYKESINISGAILFPFISAVVLIDVFRAIVSAGFSAIEIPTSFFEYFSYAFLLLVILNTINWAYIYTRYKLGDQTILYKTDYLYFALLIAVLVVGTGLAIESERSDNNIFIIAVVLFSCFRIYQYIILFRNKRKTKG
ncbi:hypothetical protein SAMN05660862_0471 [Sphingobacterium psychroaquaticum]|uniref:Uncharacterized protein n=1 Tax=Sphingobacterium psychroaquaticum TaxID=561061 RepID=A0A1X7I695_9SPHI|nr:hypothetical protein SAMN05660862_0471 [Sphingobacterium psychroaquaticum]